MPMNVLSIAVKAVTLTYRLTTVSLLLVNVAYIVYTQVKKHRSERDST
jgi:hypothetical protein